MKRKILVTGASSAIGASICRRVVRPDDELIMHCFKNEETCRSLAEDLKSASTVYSADFNDSYRLAGLCELAAGADILINCAAVTKTGLLAHLTDNDLQEMINANITPLVKLCRAALPSMVAKRNGSIINISSVAAKRGNPGQAVYAGTKGFMEAFTRSLAAEYGHKGVRTNCVAPGAIDAGSLKELLTLAPDELRNSNALKRVGSTEDISSIVAYLCSDEAGFVNGSCIAVDGGFSRGV